MCPAPAGLEQGLRPARPYPRGAAPLGTGLSVSKGCVQPIWPWHISSAIGAYDESTSMCVVA
eukprot:6531533-Alexandrium_andersonii.AAC.1